MLSSGMYEKMDNHGQEKSAYTLYLKKYCTLVFNRQHRWAQLSAEASGCPRLTP